jgi:putative chitinase
MATSDNPPPPVTPSTITADRLRAMGVATANATAYAPVLEAARVEGDINMPLRVIHWISQILQETGSMAMLVERVIYTKADRLYAIFPKTLGTLANAEAIVAKATAGKPYDQAYVANIVYAGKNGNGDTASGDGFAYRGRGFLQLTGRGNYAKLGAATQYALEATPDLAADPKTAAIIAARYWKSAGCNAMADRDDVKAITIAVNGGGAVGLPERTAFATKGKTIWK